MGFGPRRNTSAQGETINAVQGTEALGGSFRGRHSQELSAASPRQPDWTANQTLTMPSPHYTASRWMVAPDFDMSIAEQYDSHVNSVYSDTVRPTSTAEERNFRDPSSIRLQHSLRGTSDLEDLPSIPNLNSSVTTQVHSDALQGTSAPFPMLQSSGDTDSIRMAQEASTGRFPGNSKLITSSS